MQTSHLSGYTQLLIIKINGWKTCLQELNSFHLTSDKIERFRLKYNT